MKNNDKNKNNLSPEELEKVSGGTDKNKPNIDKIKLLKPNFNNMPLIKTYGAITTHNIFKDEKLKKLAEEERAKIKKEKAENSLLPEEPKNKS